MIVANRLLKNVRYRGLSSPDNGLLVASTWTDITGSIDTGITEEGITCWVKATGQATGGVLDIQVFINGESIHIGDPWRISCDIALPDMLQPASGNFPAVYLPPNSSMTFQLRAANAGPFTCQFNAVVAVWYGKDWDQAVPYAVCFPTQTEPEPCK